MKNQLSGWLSLLVFSPLLSTSSAAEPSEKYTPLQRRASYDTSALANKRAKEFACDLFPWRTDDGYFPFQICSESGRTCATFDEHPNQDSIALSEEATTQDSNKETYTAELKNSQSRCVIQLPYWPSKDKIIVTDNGSGIIRYRETEFDFSYKSAGNMITRSTCSNPSAMSIRLGQFLSEKEIENFPGSTFDESNFFVKARWFEESTMRMNYLLKDNRVRSVNLLTGTVSDLPRSEILRAAQNLTGIDQEVLLDLAMELKLPGIRSLAENIALDERMSIGARVRCAYFAMHEVPVTLVKRLFVEAMGSESSSARDFATALAPRVLEVSEIHSLISDLHEAEQIALIRHMEHVKYSGRNEVYKSIGLDTSMKLGPRLRAGYLARIHIHKKVLESMFLTAIEKKSLSFRNGQPYSDKAFALKHLTRVMDFKKAQPILAPMLTSREFYNDAIVSMLYAGPLASETLISSMKSPEEAWVTTKKLEALGSLRNCSSLDFLLAKVIEPHAGVASAAMYALRSICPIDLKEKLEGIQRTNAIPTEVVSKTLNKFRMYPNRICADGLIRPIDCSRKSKKLAPPPVN